MTTALRLDPPDRQRRCAHDMLDGQCAWCLGLPDVPLLGEHHDAPRRRHNLVTVDRRGAECASCDASLPIGDGAVWSPGGGLMCIVCDESDR